MRSLIQTHDPATTLAALGDCLRMPRMLRHHKLTLTNDTNVKPGRIPGFIGRREGHRALQSHAAQSVVFWTLARVLPGARFGRALFLIGRLLVIRLRQI